MRALISFLMRIGRRLFGLFKKREKESGNRCQGEEQAWVNPYLSQSREIIEQILQQKMLDYRRFRPVILDTDCPGQNFGEEDDVDDVLEQLISGLNFLEICTDRPEHFEGVRNRLEKEYGLPVRILPKQNDGTLYGNMILDFERRQPLWIGKFAPEVLYLPFYKRRWNEKKAENDAGEGEDNLDIEVPIGYNMLIVKWKRI